MSDHTWVRGELDTWILTKGYNIPGVELEASGDESLAPTLGEPLDVKVGVAGCR